MSASERSSKTSGSGGAAPATDKWDRVVAALKAAQPEGAGAGAAQADDVRPPAEFRRTLIGRVRAFHASLAAWQRWSLLAGLVSLLLFGAALIYLKATAEEPAQPIIDTPGIELPPPAPTD